MPFHLTEDELDAGFEAIQHHGFSTLFPDPPEWRDLEANWKDIRKLVSAEDLDTYRPFKSMRVFAPKSRFNLRAVTHLHPVDLLIYTSLVLLIRDDIEKNRMEKSKGRCFSFRSDHRKPHQLYQTQDAFKKYKAKVAQQANLAGCKYVAVADIADFFPRIYQHRLENVVATIASDLRREEVARVLVKKFLFNVAEGTSYGIPVGPYASRNLAEAVMIDVDNALLTEGLKFVRWVDDFVFFCKTDAEAQHSLFFLARWLFEKHGLTLQSAKTRIHSKEDYVDRFLETKEERFSARAEVLKELWWRVSPYDDEDADLTQDEVDDLETVNFLEVFQEAIADQDNIDYEMVTFLLGRVSQIDEFRDEWRIGLIDIVLANLEHLYPVSDSISKFFKSFKAMEKSDRKKVSKKLLAPILKNSPPPPEYYTMWILDVFASSKEWNNSEQVLRIFNNSNSEVVRRYAALALEVNGGRPHALALRDNYASSSDLLKLAILRASKLLGPDERKFWKRGALIDGHLEKRIA